MRMLLIILALTLLACTLSSVPPTQTPVLYPTLDPALQFGTTPFAPFDAGAQSISGATLTPTLDVTGAGMGDGSTSANGAVIAPNPNCPQPAGWITYIVESGDTLGLLSLQTDTPVADLATANCLTDQDTLYVGQTIYLPTQPIVTQ